MGGGGGERQLEEKTERVGRERERESEREFLFSMLETGEY